MKSNCNHCGKAVRGRTDKKFCQLSCKNSYHNSFRKKRFIRYGGEPKPPRYSRRASIK